MNIWIELNEELKTEKNPYNGWFYLDGTYEYVLYRMGRKIAKMIRKL